MARVVLMGSSDAAVELTGAALAARLRARYIDGDELRPPARRRRRAETTPAASDAEIWLDALRLVLVEAAAVVVTTGPLTRAARDAVRARVRDVVFVELVGRESVGEPLTQDEAGFRVATGADLQIVVDRVADLLTTTTLADAGDGISPCGSPSARA